MGNISKTLYDIVQYILGFGPTVMLPLILFIISMFFKIKPSKALRSSLIVGIGFVGIYAIFGILTDNVGPAAQAMVQRTGVDLPVVDLGWPPLSAITWGSPIAPFVIPLTILINIAMLAINQTRTVDVDMWNYWHFALLGTLVYYITNSFVYALIASAIVAVIVFKLSDWAAPLGEKYFGLEGVSLPTLSSITFFPIGLLGNKIIDSIPLVRDINIDPIIIQKKFGIFGEPMMVGTILGLLLGVLAGYDVKGILAIGINIGAVMFILPRMVSILMEGLIPLSEAIKQFLNKRYPDRDDLYIGLDIAVAIGNPAIISTALLLTPISIALAFLIPGNKVLPLGDLANLAVMISMVVLACKGNVFRSVLIGIPIIIGDLLIATSVAPIVTQMAKDVQFNFPEGSTGIVSSFLDGGNPLRFWLLKIFDMNIIAIILIPVILVLVYVIYKKTYHEVMIDNK